MQNPLATVDLFRRIAARYDRMNRLMTLGQDLCWRRAAVRRLLPYAPKRLLDLAAGTGDFARVASEELPSLEEVYLVDLAEEMLAYAPAKKPPRANLTWHILVADAHALPFDEGYFDAITVGYGVRNFTHRPQALREMYRVLRPGGVALILETGLPQNALWKSLFWLYFRFYVPLLGTLFAKDRKAYTYLPESTAAFPHREQFLYLCQQAGFTKLSYISFWGGVSILYEVHKPA